MTLRRLMLVLVITLALVSIVGGTAFADCPIGCDGGWSPPGP